MLRVRGVIRGNTVLVENDLQEYEGQSVTVMIPEGNTSIDFKKYRGRGEKMFPETDPQDYVTGLRTNDRL